MINQETIKVRHFSGAGVETVEDKIRLGKQIDRVLAYINGGEWMSLQQIAIGINAPHASVSAQLRNLRKAEHGSYIIERKNEGDGYFLYRLAGVDLELKPAKASNTRLLKAEALNTALKKAKQIKQESYNIMPLQLDFQISEIINLLKKL